MNDSLAWSHTHERRPDFTARITHPTGFVEDVARLDRDDTTKDPRPWRWSMLSIFSYVGVEKPGITINGNAATKDEPVGAVREAWERESAWRAGVRAMTPDERAALPRTALRIAYGCGWSFAHAAIPLPAEALAGSVSV